MDMHIAKTVGMAVLGLAVGVGGAMGAWAKGHDMGVADGTELDPGIYRGGVVAGIDIAGIGFDTSPELCSGKEASFCGVVGDPGQTYGQTVVSIQAGDNRVIPVVNGQR